MTNWIELDLKVKEWVREAGQLIKNSFSKTLIYKRNQIKMISLLKLIKKQNSFLLIKFGRLILIIKLSVKKDLVIRLRVRNGIIWIIDPIDGTMNFVHMQRNFAISIGIYENGVGQIGIIYDVIRDELYHTIKNNGVYMNDIALKPLEEVNISEAIIGMNATWVTENKRIDPSVLGALVKDVRGTRSYGSAAIELASVAAGRLDAHISLRLAPWDFAAGKILVEELGGIVTDLRGKPLKMLEQNTIIVSKPGLHETIMKKYLNNGNW